MSLVLLRLHLTWELCTHAISGELSCWHPRLWWPLGMPAMDPSYWHSSHTKTLLWLANASSFLPLLNFSVLEILTPTPPTPEKKEQGWPKTFCNLRQWARWDPFHSFCRCWLGRLLQHWQFSQPASTWAIHSMWCTDDVSFRERTNEKWENAIWYYLVSCV